MTYVAEIRDLSNFQRSINIDLDAESKIINTYYFTPKSIEVLSSLFIAVGPKSSERSIVLNGPYGCGKSFLVLIFSKLLESKFAMKYPNLITQLEQHKSFINTHTSIHKNIKEVYIIKLYGNYASLEEKFDQRLDKLINDEKINTENVIDPIEKFKLILLNFKKKKKVLLIAYDEFSLYIENKFNNPNNFEFEFLQKLAETTNNSTNANIILITHKSLGQYSTIFSETLQNDWRKIEGRFLSLYLPPNIKEMLNLLLKSLNNNEYNLMQNKFFKNKFLRPSERKHWWTHIQNNKNLQMLHFLIEEKRMDNIWPLHPLTVFLLPAISAEIGQNERSIFSYINSIDRNSLRSWLQRLNIDLESNVHRENDTCITVDMLWDYFDDQIRNDIGMGNKSDIWRKTHQVLIHLQTVTDNEILVQIVKIIGVLEICQSLTHLRATSDIINLALTTNTLFDSENALTRLLDRKLIRFNGIHDKWDIYEGSSIHWKEEVENVLAKKIVSDRQMLKTLNKYYPPIIYFPRKYNDDKKITRYFISKYFSSISNQLENVNWESYFEEIKYPDGIIIYFPLVEENNELISTLLRINKKAPKSVVFAISKTSLHIKNIVKELFVLNMLLNTPEFLSQDYRILGEIQLEIENLVYKLQQKMKLYVIGSPNTTIINQGKIAEFSNVSIFLSEISDAYFPKYPTINNELFNKNIISSPVKTAMIILMDMMLGSTDQIPNISGFPAHKLLYKTMTTKTGIKLRFDSRLRKYLVEFKWNLEKNWKDEYKIKPVIEYIIKTINSTENITTKNIINSLQKTPFGLRKGVIVLLLACIFISFKEKEIVLFDTSKQNIPLPLDAKLLYNIVFEESDYRIYLRDDSQQRRFQNTLLNKLFTQFISNSVSEEVTDELIAQLQNNYEELNNEIVLVKNADFDFIVKKWLFEFPAFVRETKLPQYIGKNTMTIRDAIKFVATNPNVERPKEINLNNLDKLKHIVTDVNSELRTIIIKLNKNIVEEFFTVFGIKTNSNFQANVILQYVKSIKEEFFSAENFASSHTAFKEKEKQTLFNLLNEFDQYEEDYIIEKMAEKIAYEFTSLLPKDWNDDTLIIFRERLIEFAEKVLKLKSNDTNIEKRKNLTYVENGVEKSVSFTEQELSPIGMMLYKTLLNQLELSGRSLSPNEKYNILNELLQNLL